MATEVRSKIMPLVTIVPTYKITCARCTITRRITSIPTKSETNVKFLKGKLDVEEYLRLIKDNKNKWENALAILKDMLSVHSAKAAGSSAFNGAINACARGSQSTRAISLLRQMKQSGVSPSYTSYSNTLTACNRDENWKEAVHLLNEMESDGFTPVTATFNLVLSACVNGNQRNEALLLFESMPGRGLKPNLHTFELVIGCLSNCGQWKKALSLLESMELDEGFKPSIDVIAMIIDALEKAGQWREAINLINTIEELKIQPTLDTLKAIVRIAIRGGERQKVFKIADTLEMRYNINPSVAAYDAIFSACRDVGEWEIPLKLLSAMDAGGLKPNAGILATIIEALCSDSQWGKALDLFNSMKERGIEPNRRAYNATVIACVSGGQLDEAVEVLKLMSRKYDDTVACSYGGLIRMLEQERMWLSVLKVVSLMSSEGKTPDLGALNAGIRACYHTQQWEEALAHMKTLHSHRMPLENNSTKAAMSCCALAGKWNQSMPLLRSLKVFGSSAPSAARFAMAIDVLEGAGLHQEAIGVMTEARSLGFYAKAWSSRDEVDLHGCSAAEARTVLRCIFEDIRIGSTRPRFLTIVTGRGRKSKGTPVLTTVVSKIFSASGLTARNITGNGGYLLTKDSLETWLLTQKARRPELLK